MGGRAALPAVCPLLPGFLRLRPDPFFQVRVRDRLGRQRTTDRRVKVETDPDAFFWVPVFLLHIQPLPVNVLPMPDVQDDDFRIASNRVDDPVVTLPDAIYLVKPIGAAA